ncbi:MAG: hypothetical protein KDD70_12730 [Bdellovibrionales bacterium]|nr:hypothetical protein [Bdellovibrionales bacterium]
MKQKKFQTCPRWLAYLSLGLLLSIGSGCSLIEQTVGQLVPAGGELYDTITGFVTDSDGEIVAYCCLQSCIKAESVAEFKAAFKKQVLERVDDQQRRADIISGVTFVHKPLEDCNAESNINFILNIPIGSELHQEQASLPESELGEQEEPSNNREKVKKLLEQFADEARNGATLLIEMKVCPSGGSSSSSSQAASAPDCSKDAIKSNGSITEPHSNEVNWENSDFSNEAAQNELACITCTPAPATEKEIKLDWSWLADVDLN